MFGVLFRLYFSTQELEKITKERSSFKTWLKTEFLWPHTGHEKVLETIPDFEHWFYKKHQVG